MSDNDTVVLKALKSKLNGLLKIVLAEAENNEGFRKSLEELLLGSPAPKSSRKASQTGPKPVRTRKVKEKFNTVGFLEQHGEDGLIKELSSKSETELKGILRNEKLKRPKGVKVFEREQMIEEIVKDAKNRLYHGLIPAGG